MSRRHQVGRELDALERDVEDLADRADHERLGQAGHADEQAMAAREDGGEDLLDDFGLADDGAAKLFEICVRAWLNWARYSLMRSVDTGDFPWEGAAPNLFSF